MAVWHAEEAQRHPACGTYAWEWEEDPNAWEPDIYECKGCKQREMFRDEVMAKAKNPAGWEIRLYRPTDEEDRNGR